MTKVDNVYEAFLIWEQAPQACCHQRSLYNCMIDGDGFSKTTRESSKMGRILERDQYFKVSMGSFCWMSRLR